MNRLHYKDFEGSVEFSEADGVFYGKIEGIGGLVNFEGESVTELTNSFHEAVEDYLVLCAEEGINPYESPTKAIDISLSNDLYSKMASLAKQTGLSINSFIKKAIENQIAAMM